MNIFKTDLFPYIAGDSLIDRAVVMTISKVQFETVVTHGGEVTQKPVIYFKESTKGLILNKTNAKAIAKLYGGETDDWTGKTITLYSEKVKAFGEVHNAARLRAPKNSDTKPAANGNSKAVSPDQRSKNADLLHGTPDDGIGEDEPSDFMTDFAAGICVQIPYYKNATHVKSTIDALEIGPVAEDTAEMVFDALATHAKAEADKEA